MSQFSRRPDVIERRDVEVMQRSTRDELPSIQRLWSSFERDVGLRGRKMYGLVQADTYTTCTPIRGDDDPEAMRLERGVLPGGRYLRGRLSGEPPEIYTHIGPGVQQLEAMVAASLDLARPVVEFYRRRDEIELWVPVLR